MKKDKNNSDNSMVQNILVGMTRLVIFSVGVFAFKKFLHTVIYDKNNDKQQNNENEKKEKGEEIKNKLQEKKKEVKNTVEDEAEDTKELGKEARNLIANALSKASQYIKAE
jgi:Sec-independent protein translocase protein TatA